jgi:integrase
MLHFVACIEGGSQCQSVNLKKDADAWATTALHQVASGVHAPRKTTVSDAFQLWVNHSVDEGLERSTTDQRARHLKLHIAPFIGRVKLAELTTPAVSTFMDALRDAKPPRSAAMRRHVLTSLSGALTYAKTRGMVAQNVCQGVRVKSDNRHRDNGPLKAGRDFPTKAELKLLIDSAPERWRPFIITAIFTGMRTSELRGVRWSDVDLQNAALHVAQRVDQWGKIGSPKSVAGKREIPLPPIVVNALKQHRLSANNNNNNELVFSTTRGTVILHNNFYADVWLPLLKRCGGLKYEFHSLRHAAASLFIELGWQPKRIMSVMGHSSITQTYDRYGHLFPQGNVAEDMRKLEAAVVAA